LVWEERFSTATTTVLSILSLTTTPTRSLTAIATYFCCATDYCAIDLAASNSWLSAAVGAYSAAADAVCSDAAVADFSASAASATISRSRSTVIN
jgi:hypothetical protein